MGGYCAFVLVTISSTASSTGNDVDDDIMADWNSEMSVPLTEEYQPEDIFGSVLFLRSQPESDRQRLSWQKGLQAMGLHPHHCQLYRHGKLKILLIGRAKLPRSFFFGVKTLSVADNALCHSHIQLTRCRSSLPQYIGCDAIN